MLKIVCTAALSVLSLLSYAQKDLAKYKERAEEVRQEVWDNAVPEFKVKESPAEMANESAVILARSFEIINSSKVKIKFTIMGFGAARRNMYRTLVHERVKINDKAALDEYSTIEYQKKLDKTTKIVWTKVYNKMDTYIGAKIVKPGGKEVIVNTDEEVLTRNNDKEKEGKLAISNLQVGDILDYYINVEEMQETGNEVQGPYTFIMGGEYPMLYYAVRLQLDEKVGVKYISANGAPSFKESKTTDDDILLELKMKNLPKFQSNMWTSPSRQFPYLVLQYKLSTKYDDGNGQYASGQVQKGFITDKLVEQFKNAIPYFTSSIDFKPRDIAYDYFGGKKNMKNIPEDSVVKVLYDAWRYNTFCSFATDKIDLSNDINYQQANSLQGAVSMSHFLQGREIDHDIVLVCSRNSSSLKNVMNMTDMDAMVRVQLDGKTYWMAFEDITTGFNEIPARFQGEEAIYLHGEKGRRAYDFTQGKLKIPTSTAAENNVVESIAVNFAPANMQQLLIDRTCTLSGTYQGGEQKRLLLMQDMESTLAKTVAQKTFTERLLENKKTQKLVPEFASAFSKEKSDWKKYFKKEIVEQFEEEPKEVTAFEIKADGLLRNQPSFVYRSSFSMDNFVKKAGNNYILDAGKLIGKYSKLEEKERNRSIDVYMYSARSFTYNISVAIPDGYNVKGVEELAKNVTNETGAFTSSASVDGSQLKLTVSRSFNKNFEPATAWPKLVELLDAVYDFYGKKILFEKKK